MKYRLLIVNALVLVIVSSCGENSSNRNKGPIKLGDSATIITETDSQYLRDDVIDLEPHSQTEPVPEQKPEKPAKDTSSSAIQTVTPRTDGYRVDFGEAEMVLSGLDAKDARRQNAERDNGLTYAIKSGKLESGKVVFYGVKNVTVKQRYQSKLVLKSGLGSVDLRDLGLYTSGWSTLPAAAASGTHSFSLSGLNQVTYASVNNNKIKNAADRELRKRRAGSKTIQGWMKEIRGIRNANDKPCDVILDNVQWQVSGTDAKGRPFQKNIRIDA